MAFQGLLGGPAVETPQMQRMWIRSLVGELRSHMLHSRTKKKNKEWLSWEFPGGQDWELSLPRAWVPSLVRELRSHKPQGMPPTQKYLFQEGKIWTNTLTKAWRNKQRQVLMVIQTVCQFGNKYQSLNTINLHCFIIIKINFF